MTPVEAQPVRVQPRDVHPGDAALKGDSALQTPRPQMAVAAATRPVQLVNTAKVMKSIKRESLPPPSPEVRREVAQGPPDDVAQVLNGGFFTNDPFLPPCTPFTPSTFQFSPCAPFDKVDERVDQQIEREQEAAQLAGKQKQRKRKRAPGPAKNESSAKKGPARNLASAHASLDLSMCDTVQKKLLAVWQLINDYKFALPFRKPVQEKDAPGYFSKIVKPMDLATIKRQIDDGTTNSFEQLTGLIALIHNNAKEFNGSDGDVAEYAKELQTYSADLISAATATKNDKSAQHPQIIRGPRRSTEAETAVAQGQAPAPKPKPEVKPKVETGQHPTRPSLPVESPAATIDPANMPLLAGAAAELVAQAIATNTNAAGGSTTFRTLIDQAQTMSGDPLIVERIQGAMKVFKGNSAGNTKRMLEDLLPGVLRRPRVTPSKKKTGPKKPSMPKKSPAKKSFPTYAHTLQIPSYTHSAYDEPDDLFACSTSEDSHSDLEQRIEELPHEQDGLDREEWEHEDWEQQMEQLEAKAQEQVRTPTDATTAVTKQGTPVSPVCSPTGVLELAPSSVKATDLGRLSPSARLFQPALRELLQQPAAAAMVE